MVGSVVYVGGYRKVWWNVVNVVDVVEVLGQRTDVNMRLNILNHFFIVM